jgi:predicted transcriptional regulator
VSDALTDADRAVLRAALDAWRQDADVIATTTVARRACPRLVRLGLMTRVERQRRGGPWYRLTRAGVEAAETFIPEGGR